VEPQAAAALAGLDVSEAPRFRTAAGRRNGCAARAVRAAEGSIASNGYFDQILISE